MFFVIALQSSLHDFLELDDRIATKMDLSLKDLRSQLSILNSPSEDDSVSASQPHPCLVVYPWADDGSLDSREDERY